MLDVGVWLWQLLCLTCSWRRQTWLWLILEQVWGWYFLEEDLAHISRGQQDSGFCCNLRTGLGQHGSHTSPLAHSHLILMSRGRGLTWKCWEAKLGICVFMPPNMLEEIGLCFRGHRDFPRPAQGKSRYLVKLGP